MRNKLTDTRLGQSVRSLAKIPLDDLIRYSVTGSSGMSFEQKGVVAYRKYQPQIASGELTSYLSEQERRILLLRLDENGFPQMTLDDVSSRMGIKRDVVRQTQNNALSKLLKLLKKEYSSVVK